VLGHRLSHNLGQQGRWTGAGLLIATGLYGLIGALRSDNDDGPAVPTGRRGRLILVGFALSIDNLVIGFALGNNHLGVAEGAIVIGAVSVALSFLGLELGDRIGIRIGERGELLGSAVLIAVGGAIAAGIL
jgi:manganese efflux pump family protein